MHPGEAAPVLGADPLQSRRLAVVEETSIASRVPQLAFGDLPEEILITMTRTLPVLDLAHVAQTNRAMQAALAQEIAFRYVLSAVDKRMDLSGILNSYLDTEHFSERLGDLTRILFSRGQQAYAQRAARSAVAASPENEFHHERLAAVLLQGGHPEESIVAAQTAIRLELVNTVSALLTLARAHVLLGQADEAQAALGEAGMTLDESSIKDAVQFRLTQAMIEQVRGDTAARDQAMSEALALIREDYLDCPFSSVAETYAFLHKPEESLHWLRRAAGRVWEPDLVLVALSPFTEATWPYLHTEVQRLAAARAQVYSARQWESLLNGPPATMG